MIDRLPEQADLQAAGLEVFNLDREAALQVAAMGDTSEFVRTLITMGTTGVLTATKFAWIAVRLIAIGILAERKRAARTERLN